MTDIIRAQFDKLPSILDEAKDDFMKFFSDLSFVLQYNKWEGLYNISDKAMTKEEFVASVEVKHSKFWSEFNKLPLNRKGMSLQIDAESFNELHSCLIGRINFLAYMLCQDESSPISQSDMHMAKVCISWSFTYKNNKFVIISAVPSLQTCD